MSTFINCIGANFSNPLIPTLKADPILNVGSLMLVDFKKTSSFPLQAAPPDGTIIKNLVEGQTDGAVLGTTFGFENGAVVFSGVGQNEINFGGANHNNPVFDLSALNPNFMLIAWIKIKSSDFSNSAYGNIIGRYNGSANLDSFQFTLESGAGGVRPRGGVSTDVAFGSGPLNADMPKDSVAQIAMAYEGTDLKIFLNGALVRTIANITRGTRLGRPTNNSASYFRIGGSAWKGSFYRGYLENLSVSGKTATAQVAADYAANALRFS